VLTDVSFDLHSGEKIGLIGANGSGKTTIFKVLAEKEAADAGHVSKRKGLKLSYLSQIPEYPEEYRVIDVLNEAFADLFSLETEMRHREKAMETAQNDELEFQLKQYNRLQKQYETQGGYEISERRSRICSGLQLSNDFLQRNFASLSGGEKTSVILAKNLLESPDTLLLDEPTNHLDMQAVQWLEEFLQKFAGSVIIVSHDRYFLDKTVTRILELEGGGVTSYVGNYSEYHRQKEQAILGEFEQFKNVQKQIKAMKAAAERYRIWGRINTDNPAHMARAKRLEAKIEELQQIQRPQTAKTMLLNANGSGRSGNEVFSVKGLSKII